MSDASVHIAAWEAAGLIDQATADRLRTASEDRGDAAGAAAAGAARGSGAGRPPDAARAFGPAVTIPEVFGYLGGGFLLGAWSAWIGRASAQGDGLAPSMLALVAAVGLSGFGLWLRGRGERESRAAGVAFFVATSYTAVAGFSFGNGANMDGTATALVATGAALLVAVLLRIAHPSLLTQLSVLTWLTSFGGALLAVAKDRIAPSGLDASGTVGGPDPALLVVASAAWWLAIAVAIALIGVGEARTADRRGDDAGRRRAALSRLWAGCTAVLGTWSALTTSGMLADGTYGRILPPFVAELAVLLVAAVLLERALRRGSVAFVYAAALGLIVALTDVNVSYLSAQTEVALLIEGLILLGVGVAADRVRRRIRDEDAHPADGPTLDDALGVAPEA